MTISRLHTRLLALILLGLVVWLWPTAWRYLAPALSPFLAVCSAVALRSVTLASLLAVPMLVLVVVRWRFWCRHLCPVGLLSEYCGKASRSQRAESVRLFPNSFSPGRLLALATLGGAIVGYPFLLWMDPLAIFGGFFNVTLLPGSGVLVVSMLALPVVMLVSFAFPGKWCARICPLGASQELLAIAGDGLRRGNPGTTLEARRSFLALAAGAALPVVVSAKDPPLRPPGSVAEKMFRGDCIRCGSCVRACPTGIIQPDVASLSGLLAPTLCFSGTDYCLQDCNRCGEVCPSGVIQRLRLEEKNAHIIGIAEIDLSACLLALDRECGVCVVQCPREAIEEVFSPETYTTIVRVVEENCNGCGACVGICPEDVVRVNRERSIIAVSKD